LGLSGELAPLPALVLLLAPLLLLLLLTLLTHVLRCLLPTLLTADMLACPLLFRMGVLRLTTPVLVTGFVLDPSKAAPPRAADPEGMLHFALQGPDQAARIPPAMAAGWQAAYDQGSERIVQVRGQRVAVVWSGGC
jgi:hypothetical protein